MSNGARRRVRAAARAGSATVVACLITAGTAGAATTPTLGNVQGHQASSLCADGSHMVGLVASSEWRGYLFSVAALCRDAGGAETVAGTIGRPEDWGFEQIQSRCADDDVANGIFGRAGDILDAIGIGCEGSDGILVGGTGGELRTDLDCAAGERLSGLEGTFVDYFGLEVVSSVTGLCTAYRPVTKDDCKDDGWQRYEPSFRNQGDCVSTVVTGGRGA